MIVLSNLPHPHGHGESDPLAPFLYHRIERFEGPEVPFEPHKFAEAMMKAFLAVCGSNPDRKRRQASFDGINAAYERAMAWSTNARLFAVDFKRGLLQATRVRMRTSSNAPKGTGVCGGFFSAAKPNLRNAP